jgi:hypothetical protein
MIYCILISVPDTAPILLSFCVLAHLLVFVRSHVFTPMWQAHIVFPNYDPLKFGRADDLLF